MISPIRVLASSGFTRNAAAPADSQRSRNPDIGALVGQAVGGGAAGAILTFIVGRIKNAMVKA